MKCDLKVVVNSALVQELDDAKLLLFVLLQSCPFACLTPVNPRV
jgi:hypothetical protein